MKESLDGFKVIYGKDCSKTNLIKVNYVTLLNKNGYYGRSIAASRDGIIECFDTLNDLEGFKSLLSDRIYEYIDSKVEDYEQSLKFSKMYGLLEKTFEKMIDYPEAKELEMRIAMK